MYGPGGERRLTELELPWLPGYEGSAPVRIGNAASEQLQLDVYGEVMDALSRRARAGCRRDGGLVAPARADRLPREGLGRAGRGDLGGARPAPPLHPLQGDGVGRRRPRHADRRAVPARRAGRALARAARPDAPGGLRGATTPSATPSCSRTARRARRGLLMIPLVGFLPPDDPRVMGTSRPSSRARARGFVLRYAPARPTTVCRRARRVSPLLVLARRQLHPARPLDEARDCSSGSRSGQRRRPPRRGVRPAARRLVGNFPQAFTHVGLVNTANNLDHDALGPGRTARKEEQ